MASDGWTIRDSIDLYRVAEWGAGYFGVNEDGHVQVTPDGNGGPAIDLKELVDQALGRGLALPLLVRFPLIIDSRVDALCAAFGRAIVAEGYKGEYRAVYPVKVNQQRRVVEALLDRGNRHQLGLEAGSKPELLVALAMAEHPESLLVLNGYKDYEYVETALLATKLGRNAILVVDRYRELDTILSVAERLGIAPRIGLRVQLDARAEGKWAESSGRGSKFGLDPGEIIQVVERLQELDMLDSLVLLHFHLGSQITAIRGLRDAVQEGGRVYVELVRMGASLKYLDVGGGLAVDYDGSQSSTSSMNYDMQEYANDVVFHIRELCDEKQVPHPHILSESGRALVAHHSMLVIDVPDMDRGLGQASADGVAPEDHKVFHALHEAWLSVSDRNVRECWHDANYAREQAVDLFSHGILDLEGRARADRMYRACAAKILEVLRTMDQVPEEMLGLERQFCDIYFGNFSIFQSAPDQWAVDQLFPIMPIHRLREEPDRRGIIADLTCDSDGVIDQFIGEPPGKSVIELHTPGEDPYYLGIFLLGAYQEILGDLHNLFGDTNAVHVTIDEGGLPVLDDVVEHDTVTEVLSYVGFDRKDLLARVRRAVERALHQGRISLPESALFLRDYEKGLAGTPYLEAEAREDAKFPRPARVSGTTEEPEARTRS